MVKYILLTICLIIGWINLDALIFAVIHTLLGKVEKLIDKFIE